jgi:outer membrane protein insertion porin family
MGCFNGVIRRRALWVALICGGLGTGPARAQMETQSSPPVVKSIDVQYTGPATVSKEHILSEIRTKVGEPYLDFVVEQDIKDLYKSGAILNVRFFAQPDGNGLHVIIAVQTRSILRELVIDGAHGVKVSRVRKDTGLKLNAPINEEDLEKGRQKLIETYRARGYNDISIQYRVEPIDPTHGTARVVYTINEGEKGAVSRILFEGNEHFSDHTLRKQMKTRGKTLIAFLDKSGRLDENQLQEDLDKVREFYQNHGYIDVAVKDVRKERPNGGPITITIAITEGTQYHVGKITVSGYKVSSEENIRQFMKMKEGSVYSAKQLRDDAKAIVDAYGHGGYIDANVIPENASGGTGQIDVHYKIEEGERAFVQRVNIVGNTRTKDKVLRREVVVNPGDVFDTGRMDISKKRLEGLGYFDKVEVYPDETGIAGRRDLNVAVQEKRTGSLSFGGGFSTIDNVVFFAELSQGNFDITNWPQLTGGGQKFRLRIQLGTQRKDFLVNLIEPYFLDQRLSLGGQIYYNEADYLSSIYNQRTYGFSIEARKAFGAFLQDALSYRLENIELFNVSTSASAQIKAEQGTRTISQITNAVIWDRRDNYLLTRTGQRIAVTPYVSGGFLGGDTQIYGWDLEASQYFHGPLDTILLFNGEIAGVDTWDHPEIDHVQIAKNTFVDVPAVPIFSRLYLGGSNNLRGFDYRDVGPKDKNGEPIGGQSMARATVEFTFPIVEKARGAFFYDVGFVNADPNDFSVHNVTTVRIPPDPNRDPKFNTFNNLASDVGFGIRLNLPIGPLRLDYGIPIDKAGNSGGGKFNFNVGYQF